MGSTGAGTDPYSLCIYDNVQCRSAQQRPLLNDYKCVIWTINRGKGSQATLTVCQDNLANFVVVLTTSLLFFFFSFLAVKEDWLFLPSFICINAPRHCDSNTPSQKLPLVFIIPDQLQLWHRRVRRGKICYFKNRLAIRNLSLNLTEKDTQDPS